VADAAGAGKRLTPAYDATLAFLHYRLLPYLAEEERELAGGRLRDNHMTRLVLADHSRLRSDADNIERSRSRELVRLTTVTLVDRLDHHVRREATWIREAAGMNSAGDCPRDWALPLVIGDTIDLDALPPAHRDSLVLQRLRWMRPGDTLHLEAGSRSGGR